LNDPVSTITTPPRFSFASSTFSAAGLRATRTSGESPEVLISRAPKLIWKAETP
jgi:hypothetical protein